MRDRIKIPRNIGYAILIFFLFAMAFSFFRHEIYQINLWCFAMTGELDIVDLSKGATVDPELIQEQTRKSSATQSSGGVATIDPKNPVRTNLPKTSEPKALLLSNAPEEDDPRMPDFPKMRKFSGEEWDEENTRVRMACDGTSLYVFITCYDKEPDKLVTKYSEEQGIGSVFKDDSIEFFMMKNEDAPYYIQYIASASGLANVYFMKPNHDDPSNGIGMDGPPPDFKKPFIRVERCPEGFKIYMEIDLNNHGISQVYPDSTINFQIVRNYRGQSDPGTTCLQLFPNCIYGDNRAGMRNHDQRAFQPVRFLNEDKILIDKK